jgi:anthranilate phosphoribosyltransferase
MQQEIRTVLDCLLQRQPVDAESISAAIGAVMDARCQEVETASLLTALAISGETGQILSGAAAAMRARATRIPTRRTDLLDTCGTGGDRMRTFNISTAAAFVIAAAGVAVAKHGNRSASSSSGSADVLEALGVRIDIPADQAGRCLDELGICFCYARTFHTAMKHVAPVRQQLGFRTIFNLLGPLTNPAGAEYQLIGVSNNATAAMIAGAISQLKMRRALVVCGNNELDEVSLWGTTRVWDVTPSAVQETSWTAASFGLPECRTEDLTISSSQDSAKIIQEILEGRAGPCRDIVVANAAAGLFCHGKADTPAAGVSLATAAIDSGQAQALLHRLVDWTRSC